MIEETAPSPQPDKQDRRGAFRLLFFCLLAVGAGNTMLITAVLPPLTRTLNFPDWTAGAIFSFSALAWAVMSSFWGQKSGVWGRRPVAAIGMFGFAMSMVLFGLSATSGLMGWITHWPTLFVLMFFSRSLFGLFGSGTNPAAQAYIADRTSREERTEEIATLTSGFTLGTVLGPAFAAALIVWLGLLAPVWISAGVAIVIGVVILRYLPEKRPPKQKTASSSGLSLWRSPRVVTYLVYALGFNLAWGVMSQTFPYALMDKMGVSGPNASQFIAGAMTLGAMATLLAQLVIIPRLKLPVRDLMVSGAVLFLIGAVLMMTTKMYAVLCLIQIIAGVAGGLGRTGGTAGASLAAGPEAQGGVAGLVAAANGLGYVVSPFFGLWMYEHVHPYAPFIFLGLLLAALAIYSRFQSSADPIPPDQDNETDPGLDS